MKTRKLHIYNIFKNTEEKDRDENVKKSCHEDWTSGRKAIF